MVGIATLQPKDESMTTEQLLHREIAALKTVAYALLASEMQRRPSKDFAEWLNNIPPFSIPDEVVDPAWREGVRELIEGMIKAAGPYSGGGSRRA
jgi:hypothetical protein